MAKSKTVKVRPYCFFCGAHVGEISEAGENQLVRAIYFCERCRYQYCTSCCDTTVLGTDDEAICVSVTPAFQLPTSFRLREVAWFLLAILRGAWFHGGLFMAACANFSTARCNWR